MLQCVITANNQQYTFNNLIFYSIRRQFNEEKTELLNNIFLEFHSITHNYTEQELSHIESLIIYDENQNILVDITDLSINKYIYELNHERFKTSQFKLQYLFSEENVNVLFKS